MVDRDCVLKTCMMNSWVLNEVLEFDVRTEGKTRVIVDIFDGAIHRFYTQRDILLCECNSDEL